MGGVLDVGRRNFLKQILFGFGAVALGNGLSFVPAKANTSNKKVFIAVYVPGGYDGLNWFVPYGDSLYYDFRKTIAIPEASLIQIGSANHAFNPLLTEMADIYKAGGLAVFPACHYKNPTVSHFESRDRIHSKIARKDLTQGWLNKVLQADKEANGSLPKLYSTSSTLPLLVSGSYPVATSSGMDYLLGRTSPKMDPILLNKVKDLVDKFDLKYLVDNPLKSISQNLFSTIQELEPIVFPDMPGYQASPGYHHVSSFGKNLQTVATLVKNNLADAIYIQFPYGYDTHINQLSAHSSINILSKNLKAFYDELDAANRMQDVALLVYTEFGRTIKENGNKGTDHGWANSWFLMSKNINGGIYGAWPGLAASSARNALNWTVNIEDIFLDILQYHMGLDTSGLFTHYTTRKPLGVFL